MGWRAAEPNDAMADHLAKWSFTEAWKAACVSPESLDLGKVIGKFQRIFFFVGYLLFCKVLRNEMKVSKT